MSSALSRLFKFYKNMVTQYCQAVSLWCDINRPSIFTFDIWLVCIYFIGKVFIFIYWKTPNFTPLGTTRYHLWRRIKNTFFSFMFIFRPNWRSSMENHWMRRQNRMKNRKAFITLINFSALSFWVFLKLFFFVVIVCYEACVLSCRRTRGTS